MKNKFFVLAFSFVSTSLFAQIEKPRTNIKIEAIDKVDETPSGFELPVSKAKGLSESKPLFNSTIDSDLGKNNTDLDITKGDGLQDYKTNNGPKYFTKDKEALAEYGRDQNLGEVITSASTVNIVCRDHEYVDGDRIQVRVNDDIVRAEIRLYGTFQGFDLPLLPGINKIEFIALNQGSSGPNTAELHVYDDNDLLISAKEWNLLTGKKATFLVIKQ